VVTATAAASPPVRATVLATAAGAAKLAMSGPIERDRSSATTQPIANEVVTETEAARLAAARSPA